MSLLKQVGGLDGHQASSLRQQGGRRKNRRTRKRGGSRSRSRRRRSGREAEAVEEAKQ